MDFGFSYVFTSDFTEIAVFSKEKRGVFCHFSRKEEMRGVVWTFSR